MPVMAPQTPTAPITFDTTTARQFVTCRVCGRTLLMGERSVGYFTVSGEGPYDVCQLCVPRAHRYGLRSNPATPDEVSRARRGGGLARIGAAVRNVIGGRRTASKPSRRTARAEQPVHGTAAIAATAAAASAGAGKRSRRRIAAAAPLDPVALGAVPVGAAAIPVALAAFAQSPHARTLAGLYRTLGQPRASVVPRTATDREVILTVAWEIVWYQFRIMPDGIEQQAGQYLSELSPRWQQWNCIVTPEGHVYESGDEDGAAGNEPSSVTPPEAPSR